MDNSASASSWRVPERTPPQGAGRRFSRTHVVEDNIGSVAALPCPREADNPGWADEPFSKKPLLQSKWSYRIAKRAFDLFLAVALCPLLIPIAFFLMGVVWLSSEGPIFYRQRRVGQYGQSFYLYKFRTMFHNSDSLLTSFLAATPEAKKEWEEHYKLRVDPRVTWVGAALRRSSLDELPQIFNVLAGHMSFVGPRPVVQQELSRYGKALPFYVAAKPGITGLWQVSGRGNLTYERRVSLDVHYVKTWSLVGDLRILQRTWAAIRRCEGAY
jgi:exopolysaccharide production protein ExoY